MRLINSNQSKLFKWVTDTLLSQIIGLRCMWYADVTFPFLCLELSIRIGRSLPTSVMFQNFGKFWWCYMFQHIGELQKSSDFDINETCKGEKNLGV
jgi:hypothetical protein